MDAESETHPDAVIVKEDDVTCTLCKKYYSFPKLVDCLHTFCQNCIKQNLRKEDTLYIFACPKCLHITKTPDLSLTSLSPNLYVPLLLELYKCHLPVGSMCTICELNGKCGQATHHCLSCRDQLCSDCAKMHTFSSETAKHKVVSRCDLKKGKFDKDILSKPILFCQEHVKDECSFFCQTCSQPQCPNCIIMSHNNHKFVGIDDAAAAIKSQLFSEINDAEEPSPEKIAVATAKAELDLLQKDEDTFVQTVNEKTAQMIENIKAQSQKVLEEGKQSFSEERTKREMKLDMALRRLERRENIMRLCSDLHKEGRFEIVVMKDALTKGLNLLKEDKYQLYAKNQLTTFTASFSFPLDKEYIKLIKSEFIGEGLPKESLLKGNDKGKEEAKTPTDVKETAETAELKADVSASLSSKETHIGLDIGATVTKVKEKTKSPEMSQNLRIVNTFTVEVSTDRNRPEIISMAFRSNESCLVLDKANGKLKVLKMDGNLIILVNLEGKCKPFETFVHITSGDLIVAVYEHNLYILTKHLQTMTKIELLMKSDMKVQPLLANFAEHVIVGNLPGNEMRLISRTGKVIRKWTSKITHNLAFLKYAGGDRLLAGSWEGNGSLIMESEKDGVVFQIPGQMTSGLKWRPTDAVVDKRGTIAVCDPSRNEIALFSSKDGTPMFSYDVSLDTLSEPRCLFVDNRGRLYVSCSDGRVAVYEIKK